MVGRYAEEMRTPVVVLAAAIALTGCSNLPPLASERDPSLAKITMGVSQAMRAATHPERVQLSKLGDLDGEAWAIDLPKSRTLLAGRVGPNSRPEMLVTSGDQIARVSCAWDGSEAIGVDVGDSGKLAVADMVGYFGNELCESFKPSTSPSPKKVNGECKRMTKDELDAVMALQLVGGVIRYVEGIWVQTATDEWQVAVKTWYDRNSDHNNPPKPVEFFKMSDPKGEVLHQRDDGKPPTAAQACARAAGWEWGG